MSYLNNKRKAIFINTAPTLADQGGARDTDINVIVKRFARTGLAPAPATSPLYGDWTKLPADLRGMLEMARGTEAQRRKLPPELRDMPIEELFALTPEQLKEKLTPKKADKQPDTPAGDKT